MQIPHNRYFIELQSSGGGLSRVSEMDACRKEATGFCESTRLWLKAKNLSEKVSELNVTMFGQVQITCAPSIICLIRNRETPNITAIRQVDLSWENFGRWYEAR